MDVMGPRRCRRCVFPPFCQKSAIFSCCLPKKFLSGLRRFGAGSFAVQQSARDGRSETSLTSTGRACHTRVCWPRVLGQPLWAKPGRVRRRARFHQSLGLPRRNNLPAPIFFLPTLPARTQKCIAKGHKPAAIPLSRLREALGVYAEAFSGALLKTLGTGPGPI